MCICMTKAATGDFNARQLSLHALVFCSAADGSVGPCMHPAHTCCRWVSSRTSTKRSRPLCQLPPLHWYAHFFPLTLFGGECLDVCCSCGRVGVQMLDESASTLSVQGELTTELAMSKAALDEAKQQGAQALADAELTSKKALADANAEVDNWKEHIARVRPCVFMCTPNLWSNLRFDASHN